MLFRQSAKAKARRFWKWFNQNNTKYLFLNEMDQEEKETLMDELLSKLHSFSRNLFFEVGGLSSGETELIITADGISSHFPEVELLVDAAPSIPRWKIIKYRQPHKGEFKLSLGDRMFDPASIIFISLYSEEEPDGIGIRVCYDDYTEEEKNVFSNATFILLDSLLGEKSSAEDIDYVEIVQTPEDIDPADYPVLLTLPKFIHDRKIHKFPPEQFSVVEHIDDQGYLTYFTINFAYKTFAHREQFPWFLKIIVKPVHCNENGHPQADEAEVLNQFENYLDERIREGAVAHYIGRTTLYKSREILYYLDTAERACLILESLKEDSDPIRDFTFQVKYDVNWNDVNAILSTSQNSLKEKD